MRRVLVVSSFLISLLSIPSWAQDRLGESAFYKLNKSRGRTSSLAKKGEIQITLTDFDEQNKKYESEYVYNLQFMFSNPRKGKGKTTMDEKYFKKEFMEKLREDKNMELGHIKVRHKGYGDAHLADGSVYKNCDRIHIYDIDKETLAIINDLVDSSFVEEAYGNFHILEPLAGPAFRDVKIDAYACYGVPVVGAAMIDISGRFKGLPIRLGFDYTKR